jgi:PIN domain nuclease of toxin-antitoxin system
LLIAQALDEQLTLMSADSVFPRYLDALLPADD